MSFTGCGVKLLKSDSYLVLSMKHAFEAQGLGVAPFKIVASDNGACDGIFWCEHCGTSLKNRHFIKSADNKISVVGIDCLKKTGDDALIDELKQLRKSQQRKKIFDKQLARYHENIERQRKNNNGLTNEEMVDALKKQISNRIEQFSITLDDCNILKLFIKDGFELAMVHQAQTLTPYTEKMISVMVDIAAKKRSGAKRKSKEYILAAELATQEIMELNNLIQTECKEIEDVRKQILELTNSFQRPMAR